MAREALVDIVKAAVSAFAPGGGSTLTGVCTVTPAAGLGVLEWDATVAVPGVTTASRVALSIASHADTDENANDMLDIQTLVGVPGLDQIEIIATFSAPTSGPIKLNYMVT